MKKSNPKTMEAKTLRRDILDASYNAGACHIGSALSCVDIVLDIHERMDEQDVFLFGKASGVATYYCYLAHQGKFSKEKTPEYLKNYPLPSKEVPGIIHSFGSMGHALPVAVGMALGDRTRDVYVLLSDGECQEGSTYEACLFAGQHELTNLHVYVDDNGLQAGGATSAILDLTLAFEFMRYILHDCNIVPTVKGKGVDFMSNDYNWHYRNLTPELYYKAIERL